MTRSGSNTHLRRARGLPALRAMVKVHAERRQLANMDSTRLRDLGITRGDAEAEAARPFWDLP